MHYTANVSILILRIIFYQILSKNLFTYPAVPAVLI